MVSNRLNSSALASGNTGMQVEEGKVWIQEPEMACNVDRGAAGDKDIIFSW